MINSNLYNTSTGTEVTFGPYADTSKSHIWSFRYGPYNTIGYYLLLQGTFNNYTNYTLFTLDTNSWFDVRSIGMSASNGKAHLVQVSYTYKDVLLAIKGEGFVSGDILWGTMYVPRLTK